MRPGSHLRPAASHLQALAAADLQRRAQARQAELRLLLEFLHTASLPDVVRDQLLQPLEQRWDPLDRLIEGLEIGAIGREEEAALRALRLHDSTLEPACSLGDRDGVNHLLAIALERGGAPENVCGREDDQCHAGPENDHEARTP